MQVLRRAVVLVFLGLSLQISGAHAATARSEVRPYAARSAANQVGSWWDLVRRAWAKAGCGIDPLGQCGISSSALASNTKEGCGIDPWGRCPVSPAMLTPTTDAGCRIDPLGRCLSGH